MEDRGLRKRKVIGLIEDLLNDDGAGREQAFETLCLYFNSEDIQTAYEFVTQRGDTNSLYWLIRYLVRIECEAGFKKLYQLAQSENPVTREEACGGIAQISAEARLELFIRLLESQWEDVVAFSAAQLGRLRGNKAVLPLLEVLEHERGEEAEISVLRALGRLQDRRAVRGIEKVARTRKGKVQEEALESLSKFAAKLSLRFLKICFASENPEMKKKVYLAILNLNDSGSERYVAAALGRERDADLLTEVLSSVRRFETRSLYDTVMGLAVGHRAAKVRMMASAALRRAKSPRLMKWLLKAADSPSAETRELVLRLLKDYGAEPSVTRLFLRQYRTGSEKIRLLALDCVADFRHSGVPEFLMEIVREDSRFSHAAAVALIEGMAAPDWKLIEEILSMHPERHSLLVELFLNFILRFSASVEIPSSVETCIEGLMNAPRRSIRYLAVRCYARNRSENRLVKLLMLCSKEEDRLVRLACVKGVAEMVRHQPDRLALVISICLPDRRLFPVARKLFATVPPEKKDFTGILRRLMDLVTQAIAGGELKNRFYIGRLMSLMRDQSEGQKARFLESLQDPGWNDTERRVLLRVLNSIDIHEFGGVDIAFMAGQYPDVSSQTKREFLSFFKKLSIRPERIEQAVFDALVTEKDAQVRAEAQKVIAAWTAGACLETAGAVR